MRAYSLDLRERIVAAVAGGLEVACWADLRVAAEGATFGVFCRRFGVPLIDLGTVRLPRLIGHSRAMDLILTGRPVDAQEAHAIGLAGGLAAGTYEPVAAGSSAKAIQVGWAAQAGIACATLAAAGGHLVEPLEQRLPGIVVVMKAYPSR